MGIELFIAKRYLASKRKIQFVNIINLISIIGITVGVAALLIILSVFNGFTGIVTSILINFDPHIRITQKGGIENSDYQKTVEVLKQEQLKYAPFISGKAMIISSEKNKVVFVKGVDEKIADVSGLKEKIVLGSFSIDESNDVAKILIGLNLADRLGVVVGDEIDILSPYSIAISPSPLKIPTIMRFKVTGIYESNNKEYDLYYAYIPIKSAQILFATNKITGIDIRAKDISYSEKLKSILQNKLGDKYNIATWYDLHSDLYSMMKVERWVAYILLCLIIIVASFNLIGSLYMTVLEKRRDIGVLQSMGAHKSSIVKIFMFEGILIGLIGNFLGIIIGLILIMLQKEYHIFPLDPTVYIIPAIPVEIHFVDFIVVTFATMLLTIIASYIPAKQASKIIPIETIRWE
ncbi:MAG: Lipoprotein releasing system transmembrane protein LolC [Ignavibacteriae bacterium]|nr:MAG: Lipoprotein releasing system transmembrane protein LolC [Ignavibacteriota bacterium]